MRADTPDRTVMLSCIDYGQIFYGKNLSDGETALCTKVVDHYDNSDYVLFLTGSKIKNVHTFAMRVTDDYPVIPIWHAFFAPPGEHTAYTWCSGYNPNCGRGYLFSTGLHLDALVEERKSIVLVDITNNTIRGAKPPENQYYSFDNWHIVRDKDSRRIVIY
ncbi:hypothetical protein [Limimonas halophila]|uniref:hypothetical protein n=1 Tax=Limimonas halophila TaxID=1082479 RepID=UPI00115FE272|nr:hypothetical protein [Limimonas halophila]